MDCLLAQFRFSFVGIKLSRGTNSTLSFLECLYVQFTIVLFTSGYVFGFVALESVYVEDCSKTATVWSGSAFNADVEFSAVCGVSMSAVKTRLIDIGWVRAHETFSNFELITPFDEIGPNTDPLFGIVSEAWWTFVTRGFTIPARVEDAAVFLVGVDTVETRAVRSTYRRLEVSPISTVDAEWVGAVFSEWVGVVEDQTVAAHL